MIVKIHGANGSGKSSLMRAILEFYKFEPLRYGLHSKVLKYVAQPNGGAYKQIVVLGPYLTPCGGMDAISDGTLRLGLAEQYNNDKKALVFFEGVLASTTYGALGEMSERAKVPWVYVFLDTPYEVCLERILQRRKAKGNDKPFDGEKSVKPKFRAIESVKRRAAAYGHKIISLDHRLEPKQQAQVLLNELEAL